MMFSTNLYPRFTSTIQAFHPSTSFLDHEKDLYNHHHHHQRCNNPFVSGDCFPSRENITSSKHELKGLELEQCDEYNHLLLSETKKNKISKKDHHSKIHTSQGPRDRRVRLSIEVSKKFFYLQDLLGFDKASKTLDWLFSKSRISINELVKTKKQTSSSSVSEQSEVVFGETDKEGSDEQDKGQKKKKCVEGKRKKITRKYPSSSPVNRSRVEARARARKRTKEKLNIKKLDNESRSVCYGDCCSINSTLQSSFWSAIESDNIEESLIEKEISMLYSYQANLAVSNDSSSSSSKFNSNSFPNFRVAYEQ